MSSANLPTAPVARRDENCVVFAGAPPPGWDLTLPRNAEDSTEQLIDPPAAIPNPYGWMRDDKRENKEILDHLNAENTFTESVAKHLEGLRGTLYQEMLSAIQETDYTTPRPHGDFYYYTRTFQGKSYTVHCRALKAAGPLVVNWDGSAETPILDGEQVTLDVNQLAEGKKYCSTGSVTSSPTHKRLAYSVDDTGDETYKVFVKDLETGDIIDHDPSLEISGTLKWGADDQTLFYLTQDAAKRPYRVYRRVIGSDKPDELLYENLDDLYWTGIGKTLDSKYLLVEASSKETTEMHFLDLTDPNAKLECIAKKRSKVLYEVEHRNGMWWILSNVGELPNMALFAAPAVANCQDSWKLVTDGSGTPLFDGGTERALDDCTCFKNHVVFSGREGGIPRVWVANVDQGCGVSKFERLLFDEDAYDVGLGRHFEMDTDKVAVAYDSLVTPTSSIEIDMDDTSKRNVLKEKAVPGYDRELFGCERTTALARDGKTEIPVSIVYRKDVMEEHKQSGKPVHVHLYGYGSYGACMEASFSSTRLALLNRGVVYVIAHVRGGGEMGRQWYEEPNGAKYLCKKNTFNDFVDVARWLTSDRQLTSSDKLSCEGRSAGGLLIGASINQAPELFKVALLGVPFVDVVCTMTDASIPLTTGEWEEWGNPNEEKFLQYMREYCPMQNVQKKTYPTCLLTGGLHDPRVAYWEPAKFAATLRHGQAPDSGPVCVKMDMSAGHFSASDRYKYLKELSFDYAFLLDHLGLAN